MDNVQILLKTEGRFNSEYNLNNSMSKFFGYFGAVAKKPFVVCFKEDGKLIVQKYKPVKKVVISQNLFREYDCLKYVCSRCCFKIRDWNIYTEQQHKDLITYYSNEIIYGKNIFVYVNGKMFNFYVEDNTKIICNHLDKENNLCSIHKINPIHCALPLIKFKLNNRTGKTYITREYFGRNWLMKCPVKFKPMTEEGFKTTIWMLSRVERIAIELEIETHLRDVINKVKDMWKLG